MLAAELSYQAGCRWHTRTHDAVVFVAIKGVAARITGAVAGFYLSGWHQTVTQSGNGWSRRRRICCTAFCFEAASSRRARPVSTILQSVRGRFRLAFFDARRNFAAVEGPRPHQRLHRELWGLINDETLRERSDERVQSHDAFSPTHGPSIDSGCMPSRTHLARCRDPVAFGGTILALAWRWVLLPGSRINVERLKNYRFGMLLVYKTKRLGRQRWRGGADNPTSAI